MISCMLYIPYFDRIDVSKGIDVNKTSKMLINVNEILLQKSVIFATIGIS